jgi:hypothetical protein
MMSTGNTDQLIHAGETIGNLHPTQLIHVNSGCSRLNCQRTRPATDRIWNDIDVRFGSILAADINNFCACFLNNGRLIIKGQATGIGQERTPVEVIPAQAGMTILINTRDSGMGRFLPFTV